MRRSSLRFIPLLLSALVACPGGSSVETGEPEDTGARDSGMDTAGDTADPDTGGDTAAETEGFARFVASVQPAIEEHCATCHLGERFGFASLQKTDGMFTPSDSCLLYTSPSPRD